MKEALIIAKIIKDTPVELRGNLFENIGIELRRQEQGYTSSLFIEIANTYGIKK